MFKNPQERIWNAPQERIWNGFGTGSRNAPNERLSEFVVIGFETLFHHRQDLSRMFPPMSDRAQTVLLKLTTMKGRAVVLNKF